MNPKALVKEYLAATNIMQLGTSVDNQPWVCTVHFYSDEQFNFYWLSTLERSHSKQISQNNKVSAAIMVHENTLEEPYVIGITLTGTAELVGSTIAEEIGAGYNSKLNKKPTLLSDIANNKNPHQFYRLITDRMVLFDNKNFPDSPRIELEI